MKSTRAFKILSIALAAAVVFYFLVQGVRYLTNPYATTRVYTSTTEESVEASGWLVREEEAFRSEAGTLSHTRDEGEKVGKGQVIATAYDSPGALEAVADKSMERGIGARGLRAVLEEVMSQIMYDIPSDNSIVEVDITPESVRDGAEPQLIRAPTWALRPSGPKAAAWPARTVQPEGETIQFHATDRAEGETSPPFPSTPARLRWNPSSSFR